ncbi:hypothetical protein BDF19DRAFT_453561 [Syncephalis fuscata]|nr:hypothetical protein BDF19DRAFT_453561 [Syncephalis fuscata]
MYYHWPSFKYDFNHFWEHEWYKHGSHAILPNPINNNDSIAFNNYAVVVYFRTTLNLYHLLNINAIIRSHNISVMSKNRYKDIQAIARIVWRGNVISCHRSSIAFEIRVKLRICNCRQIVFIDPLLNTS